MKKLIRPSACVAVVVLGGLSAIFTGCSSLTPEAHQEKREELDAMSDAVLVRLLEKQPEVSTVLEQSAGYAVADMSHTKVPVFGAGKGFGVVIDKRSNARTYVEVSQFEVGGGLGVQTFKAVVLFENEGLLEQAMKGFWHFDAGAEATAGDSSADGSISTRKGYRAYKISEGGAIATLTIKAVRAKPF